MDDRKLFDFDPEAPGLRGAVGMFFAALAIAWKWFAGRVQQVIAYFQDMPARVRGVTLIMTAIFMLLLVTLTMVNLFAKPAKAEGPVLAAALVAPYEIETRPVPPIDVVDAQAILPAAFGEHTAENIAVPIDATSDLNRCLLSQMQPNIRPECSILYGPVGVGSGSYVAKTHGVHIVAAYFGSGNSARAAMVDLVRYIRQVGQAGNYALSVTSVDFLYSYSNGWVSFTWRRGPWVFNISSQFFSGLEQAAEKFPY